MLEPTDFRGFLGIVNRQGFAWRNLIGRQKDKGTWTPALTFATPGDLSVSYTTQVGWWWRLGEVVLAHAYVECPVTTGFTFSSASGNLTMTGLQFVAKNESSLFPIGACAYENISRASYSQVSAFAEPNTSTLLFSIDGMGQTHDNVKATDMTSAAKTIIVATVAYAAD